MTIELEKCDEVLMLKLFYRFEAMKDEIDMYKAEIERYKVLLGEKMPKPDLKQTIGELCRPEVSK